MATPTTSGSTTSPSGLRARGRSGLVSGAAGRGRRLAPWAPSKLYEQAIPASVRDQMRERLKDIGERSFWSPPEDATPEQLEEFEDSAAKMLVPDESITTWVDVSGDPIDRSGRPSTST